MFKKPFKPFRAKTVKEKITKNISDFSEYNFIHTLTKPRSPQTIVYVVDPEDDWMVNILYYKTKTGEIVDTSVIIKPDVEHQLNHLLTLGWQLKK